MNVEQGNPCSVCENTAYNLIDGFLYCVQCGSVGQQAAQYELDNEELFSSQATRRINKGTTETQKKGEQALEKVARTFSSRSGKPRTMKQANSLMKEHIQTQLRELRHTNNRDAVNHLPERYIAERNNGHITARNDAPPYFQSAGIRLAAFTGLLARATSVLVIEMGFPEEIKDQTLYLWQTHLKNCGVAFSDEEIDDDVKKCFHGYMYKTKGELFVARQKAALRRKTKRKGRLEQQSDDFWDLLTSQKVSENLHMEAVGEEAEHVEEELVELERTKKLTVTNISLIAYKSAHRMVLSPDLLFAMIYLACLQCGVRYITLSDFIRWAREGRLPVYDVLMQECTTSEEIYRIKSQWRAQSYSLRELFRMFMLLAQSLEAPTKRLRLPFEELVARLLFNLNLPSDMMTRVQALTHILNLEMEVSMEHLRRQGDIRQGYPLHVLHWARVNGNKHRSGRSKHCCFGRPYSVGATELFISYETKAMALISMAVKLCFGLDDDREYRMKPCKDVDPSSSFVYSKWAWQCRLRTAIWKGARANEVTRIGTIIDDAVLDSTADEKISTFNRNDTGLGFQQNATHFDHSVPREPLHVRDLDLPPFDEMDRPSIRTSKEHLYVPLQAVAKDAAVEFEKQTEEELQRTDVDAKATLLRCFRDTEIEFDSLTPSKRNQFADSIQNEERCSTAESRSLWYRLFPCAKGYVMYPRVDFASHALYGRDPVGEGVRLYASAFDSDSNYKISRVLFSRSFAHLLDLCSLIIGEEPETLYAALVLLEMRTLDKDKTFNLTQSLMNCESLPCRGRRQTDYSKTVDFRIRLADRDLENPADIDRLILYSRNKSTMKKDSEFDDDVNVDGEQDVEGFDVNKGEGEGAAGSESSSDVENLERSVSRMSVQGDLVLTATPGLAEQPESTDSADSASADVDASGNSHINFPYVDITDIAKNRPEKFRQIEFDVVWRLLSWRFW